LADRRTWLLWGVAAALFLLADLGAGRTQAIYTDYGILGPRVVGAGSWVPDLAVPPECAGMRIDTRIVGDQNPDSPDDVITGTNRNDLIFGLAGDDTIQGGNGDDCILGGSGNDVLGGDGPNENGEDVILGGSGNDAIDGGNAEDVLLAGPGDDLLNGVNGTDLVYGEAGNDTLVGSNATDLLDGGSSDVAPDPDTDTCTGGRAPDVYVACEGGDANALLAMASSTSTTSSSTTSTTTQTSTTETPTTETTTTETTTATEGTLDAPEAGQDEEVAP